MPRARLAKALVKHKIGGQSTVGAHLPPTMTLLTRALPIPALSSSTPPRDAPLAKILLIAFRSIFQVCCGQRGRGCAGMGCEIDGQCTSAAGCDATRVATQTDKCEVCVTVHTPAQPWPTPPPLRQLSSSSELPAGPSHHRRIQTRSRNLPFASARRGHRKRAARDQRRASEATQLPVEANQRGRLGTNHSNPDHNPHNGTHRIKNKCRNRPDPRPPWLRRTTAPHSSSSDQP